MLAKLRIFAPSGKGILTSSILSLLRLPLALVRKLRSPPSLIRTTLIPVDISGRICRGSTAIPSSMHISRIIRPAWSSPSTVSRRTFFPILAKITASLNASPPVDMQISSMGLEPVRNTVSSAGLASTSIIAAPITTISGIPLLVLSLFAFFMLLLIHPRICLFYQIVDGYLLISVMDRISCGK